MGVAREAVEHVPLVTSQQPNDLKLQLRVLETTFLKNFLLVRIMKSKVQ